MMGRQPLWQRMARIEAELRGPYIYDLPNDEINRRFEVRLREVKRLRLFKIEDEPTRRSGGTYGVVLKRASRA
jgi:hypothetical protein